MYDGTGPAVLHKGGGRDASDRRIVREPRVAARPKQSKRGFQRFGLVLCNAAQRRARRLYAADFTADAPEPAPVHGQCFGPGFSTAVDLRARSPREFFYLANDRPDCAYAYLWWPPNG